MDEISHTILPNNGGWGGSALGAGFGGLIGSWLGNGGFGGFGGRAGVGYDTGAINAIQGQLNNVSGQIANADRDLLMQTSNQNQFVGNLVNATGDAIVGAINSGAMNNQQPQPRPQVKSMNKPSDVIHIGRFYFFWLNKVGAKLEQS